MLASLFAGVAGLKNHQVKLNVTGNNIANINTIGYKLGRVTFQEALVQTLRGAQRPTSESGGINPLQLGLGMKVATIDNQFQQGGLETTGLVTDMAIQGSGFFVVSDGSANYYTRAGAFGFDGEANLIHSASGLILQGRMAETSGSISTTAAIGNLSIPFGQQEPANATTEVSLANNLDSDATESDASLVSAGTTNVTSVSGTAINGVGGSHNIVITGRNATHSVGSGTHANELSDIGTAPTTTINAGGGFNQGAGTYYYYVTAYNDLGETLGTESAGVTVDPVTDASVTVSWDEVTGATGYRIYRTETSGDYSGSTDGYIGQVTGVTTFDDTGYDASGDIPSVNSTEDLTGNETLSALGVTEVEGFRIRVDGGNWVTFSELTTGSTVNELLNAINANVSGVTASIVDGQVQIKRDYAGSGATYKVEIEDSGSCDITEKVAGASSFTVDNGTASTLQAIDTFTPSGQDAESPVSLELDFDSDTGLVTGITDIGEGGVTLVTGADGLQAGTLVVDTEDTQHAASITVYDSQGGKHTMTLTFTKSITENMWYWEGSLAGEETISIGSSGTVLFNEDGSLVSFTYDDEATSFRFNPNNGAEMVDVAFDVGTVGSFEGLTGFASDSTASAVSQDGYSSGVLEDISIDESGLVTGIFSNGITRTLAQIYLADFNNSTGLRKVGESLYQESPNSGLPLLGIAGETISASINSGALEMSNVDLSEEFTSMIVAQRGFQANARSITTSDQLLAELVQLKR
ncbi:MAG: flagellar hook-basal body complex protein [candidate division Zixibacteria bacterium]|nr:flagellar hook-basal body complex protein [candidate division Zixibacteria bacterium]